MASLVLSLVQAVLIWAVLDLRDKTKLLEQDIQVLKTSSSTLSGSVSTLSSSVSTLQASVISNEADLQELQTYIATLKGNPDL